MVAAVAALMGLTGTAQAALHLRDLGPLPNPVVIPYAAGPPGVVRGDGVRYIANPTADGGVSVLDVVTGRRRAVPQLYDCRFIDIHHGELLWACPPAPSADDGAEYGAVQNLATGAVEQVLPPLEPMFRDVDQFLWASLGDRYATIAFSGYHYEGAVAVDRLTGVQSVIANPGRDVVVDLDRASLTRKLCHGQRRGLDFDFTGGLMPSGLATAGVWAATVTTTGDQTSRLELQHCGSKVKVIERNPSPDITGLVINDRFMAWTEYSSASMRTRVVVRFHRSGRIVRSAPASPGTYLTTLLVGPRLYLVQGTTNPDVPQHLLRADVPTSAT